MQKERAQIVKDLLRLGAFLQREANRLLDDYGLNQQQFVVLKTIQEKGPLSQKEICSDLLFEKSNVSKIVKKLEQEGLVKTTWTDRDGRVSLTEIAGKGRATAAACMQRLGEWNSEWTARLSDADVKQAARILKRLSETT
jgi:DNA-binding MarR family transcriptional regulator